MRSKRFQYGVDKNFVFFFEERFFLNICAIMIQSSNYFSIFLLPHITIQINFLFHHERFLSWFNEFSKNFFDIFNLLEPMIKQGILLGIEWDNLKLTDPKNTLHVEEFTISALWLFSVYYLHFGNRCFPYSEKGLFSSNI